MAAKNIDWVTVHTFGNKAIGAVGFIDDKAVVVSAFYDDKDANYDGRVSGGEWLAGSLLFGMKNRAVTEVAMTARADPDIVLRDTSFNNLAMNLFLNFAHSLIADGVYIVYFSRGISAASGAVANALTTNVVKSFIIRKGMEKAVKSAYDASVK